MNKLWPKKFPIYSKITDNLYLGRLPLKNTGDDIAIQKEGISAVLTMTERFENTTSSLVADPVRPEEWQQLGIKHEQIEIQDFTPPREAELERAVAIVSNWLKNGEKVLVHCKAGRGRSAEVVIAYLYQKHPDLYTSFEEARLFVKSKRPHITVKPRG